jgi:transcriptional regulator with XRE-family HTH domain
MKREKLLRSKEYGISTLKYTLLNLIGEFQKKNKLKDKDLAQKLNVSPGYVSQILNGTFDHKLSKVAELAHACNTVPLLFFVDIDKFIADDARNRVYVTFPAERHKKITFTDSIPYSTKNYKNKELINDTPLFQMPVNTSSFALVQSNS